MAFVTVNTALILLSSFQFQSHSLVFKDLLSSFSTWYQSHGQALPVVMIMNQHVVYFCQGLLIIKAVFQGIPPK